MSEATASRRVLHLVVEGFPADQLDQLAASSQGDGDVTKIFQLTEASAPEALKLIFAADTVAIWGPL